MKAVVVLVALAPLLRFDAIAQELPTTGKVESRLGTLDLLKAPAGKPAGNWIKTTPGKGWFTYFRLYGPTQAYFDKSWVLPDIQRM